jgi:hypothetical protein
MSIRRTPTTIAAGAVLALAALAAVTYAAPSPSQGTSQTQMINRTENAPSTTSSVNWFPMPGGLFPNGGASVTVTVPTNTRRLINARFTASTRCFGPDAGECRVRIAQYTAGGVFVAELHPQGGAAFDYDVTGATDVDQRESHAIERSIILTAGTWEIRAQRQVQLATTSFELDDWHFAVEVSNAV